MASSCLSNVTVLDIYYRSNGSKLKSYHQRFYVNGFFRCCSSRFGVLKVNEFVIYSAFQKKKKCSAIFFRRKRSIENNICLDGEFVFIYSQFNFVLDIRRFFY